MLVLKTCLLMFFEDMFIDVSQNDDWCCFSTKL